MKTSITKENISQYALLLMMAAILLPVVKYSLELKDATPAALLIAICVATFSSCIYLWILDSADILRFRSPWTARSIYTLAIASILGTSVGVYRQYFDYRKYPFEGRWQLAIGDTALATPYFEGPVVITYSESARHYYGYSSMNRASLRDGYICCEISDFSPQDGILAVRLFRSSGQEAGIVEQIQPSEDGRRFVTKRDLNTARNVVGIYRPD